MGQPNDERAKHPEQRVYTRAEPSTRETVGRWRAAFFDKLLYRRAMWARPSIFRGSSGQTSTASARGLVTSTGPETTTLRELTMRQEREYTEPGPPRGPGATS